MNLFLECPSCGEESEHEILKETHELLVRCASCGYIYRVPRAKPLRVITIKAIVSEEDRSSVCSVELIDDEMCAIGDLLVAECGDEAVGVEITGIEAGDRRRPRAIAREISTLWTRRIEQVVVKASVHERYITLPLYARVDGEELFEIGEERTFEGIRFRITHIKLRDGAFMRKPGWRTVARKIKRIYGNRL